tara:strand:- start:1797 stop:2333 length:537 start_codon:yes stop_codon:yes gene_type:complete
MLFKWCECDKFKKGKRLELIKDSYLTYCFNTLEELALSMKPLTNFDAKDIINNIIDINEKKIINQIPENIVLKSKPFRLTLDEFDNFIFNEELFDEDSIDAETMNEKEIEYIDKIRENLENNPMEFILATERTEVLRGSFYKQSCTIFMLCEGFQTHLFKKLYYKWNSLHNKEFLLNI